MTLQNEMRLLVEEIEKEGEAVAASLVVDRAKDSAKWPLLHKHFWEISEADLAQEAREARAHRLLIMLRVTIAETGGTTRLMVHTRGQPGYASLPSVVSRPDLVALKLQQLREDIARARARLTAFRSALPDELADEIDAALAHAEQTMISRPTQSGAEAAA